MRAARTNGRRRALLAPILVLAVLAAVWFGRALALDLFTGKRWTIDSETYDKQSRDGKRESEIGNHSSEQCSEKGEEFASLQAWQRDEDGSSRSVDSIAIVDARGNAGERTLTIDVDPSRNQRNHIEESITDRNGLSESTITDDEYDPSGKRTKHETQKRANHRKRPYEEDRWTGTILVTDKMDDTQSKENNSFGIGRNQASTSTTRTTIEEEVEVTLSRASSTALVRRERRLSVSKQLTATQELKCDGKWLPWRHDYTALSTIQTRGNWLVPVNVTIQADGKYFIHFEAPDTTGSVSEKETDGITEGKCWGKAKKPIDFSGPAKESHVSISLSGTVDPKHADSLNGSSNSPGIVTRTARWNLSRKPRCSPSYTP